MIICNLSGIAWAQFIYLIASFKFAAEGRWGKQQPFDIKILSWPSVYTSNIIIFLVFHMHPGGSFGMFSKFDFIILNAFKNNNWKSPEV